MTKEKIILGQKGESLALELLRRRGYRIVDQNVRLKRGELDIIAREGDTLCFIEVKTRIKPKQGAAVESIPLFKQRKLVKLALTYLKYKKLLEEKARFDVVAVDQEEDGTYRIELIKNAFDLNDAGLLRYR